MKKINIKYSLLFIISVFLSGSIFADQLSGFYVGIGSGYDIVNNYGLIKTYSNDGNVEYQNMGNVTGYSIPLFFNFGYRFNQYLSTEALYNYSSNQSYSPPSQSTVDRSNFNGSQSSFGVTATGYLPLVDQHLYIKGRLGLAYSFDTLTTYIGNPGSSGITSVMGTGLQYLIIKNLSLDFDYINFGALIPLNLHYTPPVTGGPNLGNVDSIIANEFLLSINVHF